MPDSPPSMTRLDVYLKEHHPSYSRSQLQKYIHLGHILINGTPVLAAHHLVKADDVVRFQEPDKLPLFPTASTRQLDILYEDTDILIINKPVGIVVHPQDTSENDTVVQAVLGMRPDVIHALYDPASTVSYLRPGIVHRLDKDTSGVMVIAKNRHTLLNLAKQFQEHTTEKTYQTILYGTVNEAQTITAPIQRKDGGDKNKMGVSRSAGTGRSAISHIVPLQTWQPYAAWPNETLTFCEVKIETGRTHQIRVHAKFIGHPVIGDHLYGNRPSIALSKKLGIEHQLLHAAKLCITHPESGDRVCFAAPLPSNMRHLIPK